ncbi:MAG: hypothetical protein M0P91_11235 [Sulfuricurvum sp.]|jgi:hypothetical protein|uniref:hypothetical protein n=1 Tax=Sulfuricurvum sp. TaxID=2025608 RepID=UPI0025F4F173|nr:hypothetical protein [Sulfuricurvum sp.]MCK9373764.1 hypothetical protein [Sulfuricurvum sp.]
MQKNFSGKNRKRRKIKLDGTLEDQREPSLFKPFIYYALEISLLLLIIGTFELSIDPTTWSNVSYIISTMWVTYTTIKLFRVLTR